MTLREYTQHSSDKITMPIFKNPNNDTIRAEAAPDESWVEITEEELEIICASRRVVPEPVDPRVERLSKIDEEAALTPRAFRELVILMTEGFKTATGGALDLTVVPGVAEVYRLETEALALRSQLGQSTVPE